MSDLEARLRDFEEIVHSADKSRTGDLIEWLEERSDGRIPWAAAWALERIGDESAPWPF